MYNCAPAVAHNTLVNDRGQTIWSDPPAVSGTFIMGMSLLANAM